jgi:hypothetical protein
MDTDRAASANVVPSNVRFLMLILPGLVVAVTEMGLRHLDMCDLFML